jgi:tyrosyl-tRNA synthetase
MSTSDTPVTTPVEATPAATPEADTKVENDAPAVEVKEEELKNGMTLEQRYTIARSVGEECIQEAELRALLEKHPRPIAYDGFEPSGRMHIAQGVLKAINVNKLTSVGVHFKFWVADWFAMLNNKMGADMKKIRVVGEYMIEVWKACGMDLDNVEFLWAQDEINKRPGEYWMLVMDIARRNTLARVKRCSTIMGREESDAMPAAQIMYPCMQAADIFFLRANICQLGMDQRKVNMLAREYMDHKDVKKKYRFKPVILSHHMLMGLKQGQAKMSKSDPDSAIFMEDTAADVKRKIKKAFCPPQVVEANPILDYVKHIIFPKFGTFSFNVNGEMTEFKDYESLEAKYVDGTVHPSDLKPGVTTAINNIIEPVRQHFSTGAAKALLKRVRGFKVTR